jgi:UDP-N-acetylmuramoyl-tripeptide--D-alanyl-D-alanine ligase
MSIAQSSDKALPDELLDRELSGFSIDSRSVRAGELFFALSPSDYQQHSFTATHFGDAHDFIPQALAQGATAIVAREANVAERAELAKSEAVRSRLLFAPDVIDSLQKLARGVIDRWAGTIVAITGSAGKTTTKDLTRQVLDYAGRRVVASRKNFNNELGVPLSVLQMETDGRHVTDFDTAVIEMGMSVPGEIAKLATVAPPDIAVELLVSPVHLEYFGSIERIAEGKRELVEALKPDGIAILNADDERVRAMGASHQGRTLLFSVEEKADVYASRIRTLESGGTEFQLHTPLGTARVQLAVPGRHNITNALAAASVASVFEIKPDVIAHALGTASASEMRGQLIRFREGFSVIDDSYNSNPRSLIAMARALVEASQTAKAANRRIVVAGEMLELGEEASEMHREAGRRIAELGVERLIGVRGQANELVAGARKAGLRDAQFYSTTEAASSALLDMLEAGDWVLVKGSRSVHTEEIVAGLRARFHEITEDGK